MICKYLLTIVLLFSFLSGQTVDLSGIVIDSDSNYISSAEVTLISRGLRDTTDSLGRFHIYEPSVKLSDPDVFKNYDEPVFIPGRGVRFYAKNPGMVHLRILDIKGKEKIKREYDLDIGLWLLSPGKLESGIYTGIIEVQNMRKSFRFVFLSDKMETSTIPISLSAESDLTKRSAAPTDVDTLRITKTGYSTTLTEIQNYVDSNIEILLADAPPVAYWDFNEGNGNILTDRSGNENHGIINGATWTNGIEGNALSFDGSNTNVITKLNIASDFNVNDPIHFSVWFRPIESGYITAGQPGNGPDFFSYLNPDGTIKVNLYAGTGITSNDALSDNNWHLLSWGTNGSSLYFYLDGKLIVNSIQDGANNRDTSFWIGSRPSINNGQDYFKGDIDEIRIYNRTLDSFEVADEWNRYSQRATLIAHWDFNDDSGSVLTDKSIYGNHGTITGATWTNGLDGGALVFDGVNDFVDIGDIFGHTNLTITAWFKVIKANGSYPVIISTDDGFLGIDSDQGCYMYASWDSRSGGSGLTRRNGCAGTVNFDSWTYVVLTAQGTDSLKLFLNGQLVATTWYNDDPSGTYTDDKIGTFYHIDSPNLFNGTIDDIKIYNGILSDSVISAEWNQLKDDILPNAPFVSSPVTPTINRRPTWYWSSGGNGNGIYRYKLNDSDLTTNGVIQDNSKSYTPTSNLSNGLHTLYVQEMNDNGLWSETGKASVMVEVLSSLIWAKSMGGNSTDMGLSIAMDDSRNVYVTGYFNGTADFDPGPGVFNLTSEVGNNIYVVKLNASGNFVWAKSMGGSGLREGLSIAVDGSEGIYITGLFGGIVDFDPGTKVFNLTSTGGTDIYVVKLDTSGNFLWAKNMGGDSYEEGLSVAVDASGNVYVTGYFSGTADFDPGFQKFDLTSAGSTDIYVVKLNASGNFVWAKRMGGTSSQERANSIAVDASGNVYVTGYFSGTADFDPGVGIFNLSSKGNYDVFIVKLNEQGDFIWAGSVGGSDWEWGNSIAIGVSGNVYAMGWFYGTVDFDPGVGVFNLTSAEIYNTFVVKLNSSGSFLWAKSMGGYSGNEGGVAVDAWENIYITGSFSGTADFDPGTEVFNLTSAEFDDVFVVKLDVSGDFLWAKSMGGNSRDGGHSIAIDGWGNPHVTGYFTGTADFDPGMEVFNLSSAGDSSIFVIKMDTQ